MIKFASIAANVVSAIIFFMLAGAVTISSPKDPAVYWLMVALGVLNVLPLIMFALVDDKE